MGLTAKRSHFILQRVHPALNSINLPINEGNICFACKGP
jgi:hypothetical protein